MSAMITSSVLEKVTTVLVEALDADAEAVIPTATLKSLGANQSIDFLDIVFRIHDEFEIDIPAGELAPKHAFQSGSDEFPAGETMTVQDVVNYVEDKLAEKSQ